MRALWHLLPASALALGLVGCFEQEQDTCEYWSGKLTSASQIDKALSKVDELQCKEAVPTLEKLFNEGQYQERILRIVKSIGDQKAAAPILKKALTIRDTSKLAASIVSDWKLAEAKPELEQILTGTAMPKFREEALKALLTFEKPENIEDLLIQLAGDDPNMQGILVNKLAVEKLSEMKSAKAVPVLVKAAFMRTARGEKVYRFAREGLAASGGAATEMLIKTVLGENEELKAYARENGIYDWEWNASPEIVQLLTDTMDPKAAPALVKNMAADIVEPTGISPTAQDAWRQAQINRLKTIMLGMGHMPPAPEVIEPLVALIKDPNADARAQRLQAASVLAYMGTAEAQDRLLTVYKEETDNRFRAPLLFPLVEAIDASRLAAFDELVKEPHALVKETLDDERVKGYLAALRECKDDTSCWVKKLDSEDKWQVIKAALMLARGQGDVAAVRQALLDKFGKTPPGEIDVRRFTLMALTRIGDAATGQQLLELGKNATDKYWPGELQAYGAYLAARK